MRVIDMSEVTTQDIDDALERALFTVFPVILLIVEVIFIRCLRGFDDFFCAYILKRTFDSF